MLQQPFFMGMRQTLAEEMVRLSPMIVSSQVDRALDCLDEIFIDMQNGFLYTPVTSEFLLF